MTPTFIVCAAHFIENSLISVAFVSSRFCKARKIRSFVIDCYVYYLVFRQISRLYGGSHCIYNVLKLMKSMLAKYVHEICFAQSSCSLTSSGSESGLNLFKIDSIVLHIYTKNSHWRAGIFPEHVQSGANHHNTLGQLTNHNTFSVSEGGALADWGEI